MKWKSLIIFLALSILTLPAKAEEIEPSKVQFYMYGAYWCPHCQNVKEGIWENFGEGALTYYELEGNEHNKNKFVELFNLAGISGTPATAIFYDGELYAVIEGEFDVSKTGEIITQAKNQNGIILVVGGRGYLLKRESEEAQKLKDIFLTGEADEAQTTKTENNSNSICGPGAILLPILGLAYLKKRVNSTKMPSNV